MSTITEIQNSFNQNSYVVIKEVVDKTTVNLFYSYTLKKINRNLYKLKHNPEQIIVFTGIRYDIW